MKHLLSILTLSFTALSFGDVLIDDFRGEIAKINYLNGYWYVGDDRTASSPGASVAEPYATVFDTATQKQVGHLKYTLGAAIGSTVYAELATNCGQQTPAGKATVDMSTATALTFKIRGNGKKLWVYVRSPLDTESVWLVDTALSTTPNTWTWHTINLPGGLVSSSKSKTPVPWDAKKNLISDIKFRATSKVSGEVGEIWIDSLTVIGPGKCVVRNIPPIKDPTTFGIIYQNSFDNMPTGVLDNTNLKIYFNNPIFDNGVAEGRVAIVSDTAFAGKALRVAYPQGQFGSQNSGAQFVVYFDSGAAYDSLYAEYKIMFPEGFEWAKGGKLPGLAGGEAPSGGMIPDSTQGFSARLMWRGNSSGADGLHGYIEQYLYTMDMLTTYGTDWWWQHDGRGIMYPGDTVAPFTEWRPDDKVWFEPGQWHTVKMLVKVNTPGEKNGCIRAWLDGVQKLAIDTIRFRGSGPETFRVDQFFFSTFMGGKDSTWAPATRDNAAFFDDLIVSTYDPSPSSAITAPVKTVSQVAAPVCVNRKLYGHTANDAVINVYSCAGREVARFAVAAHQSYVLPLTMLSAGVYAVRISDGVRSAGTRVLLR